ncbi:MAG: carboxypeptidase-like regulatory domain-containing protein, partial [Alistipes sp.]|nr:carboxypeptidase-like regulatory domain-containing protein [Alistipes sp.]
MDNFYRKSTGCIGQAKSLCVALLMLLFLSVDAGAAHAQTTDSGAASGKRRITGTVVDSDGSPLVGASVYIQNTNVGTTTNADGLFVLDVPGKQSITVSYIGYLSQTLSTDNQTAFNVKLVADTDQIEEVVVVGYGKQKRQAMVSSIATVGSRDLMQSSSGNLTNNLAGQLAGLISIQRTAEPGRDDAEFWIRGISTFKGGTNPLVLVDGVPRDINNIEPDEIDTFSILKDAAATAVYGAEGANGVILVTTKRGTISRPKISFRVE